MIEIGGKRGEIEEKGEMEKNKKKEAQHTVCRMSRN